MTLVYDEQYGEVSFAQRAAYRKFNVSPSDHDELDRRFAGDHRAITAYVTAHSPDGMYRPTWDRW